jgi:hypothetical protein
MATKDAIKACGIVEMFARPTPRGLRYRVLSFLVSHTRRWRKLNRIFEREYFKGGWIPTGAQKNLLVNTGYAAMGNRLTGSGTYSSVSFGYFAVSNGTTAPAITDTATTFYADGSQWYTKAVLSYDAFDTGTETQRWNCFLSSAENTVTTIAKFALMNANPGTVMFNEALLTTPLSKDATIERYLRYSLAFSQL